MPRALRVAALVAALALAVTLVAFHQLGLSLPWWHQGVAQRAATSPSVLPTPTPLDAYDVMGTLTVNGRTIPSAHLLPAEAYMVDWLDKGGVLVNEIRPAGWWPSDRTSLPKSVRGAAVVHAFLVAPSAIVIDAVPLEGPLNARVCVSTGPGLTSYRLQVAGRATTFDYSQPLHFATHVDALLITTDDGTWKRLLQIGASPIQVGPC